MPVLYFEKIPSKFLTFLGAALLATQTSKGEETPSSPEIEALKRTAQILDQQKLIIASQLKIAQDEKSLREAQFGASLTPREGTISVTNATAEAATIVYHQMDMISRAMAVNMKTAITPEARRHPILLLPGYPDAELISATRGYAAVKKDIDSISRNLRAAKEAWNEDSIKADEALVPPSESMKTLGSAGSFLSSASPYTTVLNSALSTLALLRVDRAYTGVQLPEEPEAFIAMLGDAMRQEGTFSQISIGWLDSSPESALFNSLVALDEARVNAKYAAAEIEARVTAAKKLAADLDARKTLATKAVADAGKAIADLTGKKTEKDAKTKEIDDALNLHRAAKKTAEEELTFIGEFSNKLTAFFAIVGPHSAKLNPLITRADAHFAELAQQKLMGFGIQALMKAERLAQTTGYILFAKVNHADGTNLTRRTLLTNSFQAAGSVSITCQIQDKHGRHVFSVTDYDYRYHKAGDKPHGTIPSSILPLAEESAGTQARLRRRKIGPPHH